MNLFDLLRIHHPSLDPSNSKIHLASWNGFDNPLDVYIAGDFGEWQRWQNKQNFKRKYVISLISLPEPHKWLFVGVYKSSSVEWREALDSTGADALWYYNLSPLKCLSELAGRLVVSFKRTGRQAYLNAENWPDKATVAWIRPERLTIHDFPGYASVLLNKTQLDLIIRERTPSWRSALENVAGVYIISDKSTGKLYVGSATGAGGLWSRWRSYAETGHGGNRDLKHLLKHEGIEHTKSFQFSILEIADTHASNDDVLARESYWKDVFLTREFGYNAN
jgi:hypothetical protein